MICTNIITYRFRIYIHVWESTQTNTVNNRPAAKLAISIKLNPYLEHIIEKHYKFIYYISRKKSFQLKCEKSENLFFF